MRWVVSITIAAVLAAASVYDVRRLRAAERPLHFRLRSIKLVHDVHLRERPIDPGAVLALLPAKRLMPRPALLRTRKRRVRFQRPFGA